MAPLLSVVICTFDRAGMLDGALRSFAAIRRPADVPLELLVVDNNSRDATRAVVEQWAARAAFPIRYVFEGRQGLSSARNRAVVEAAGDWIWFVDDDVYFDAGWLEGVREGIAFFPDASMLAGRVVPAFESARPAWLSTSLLAYYGLTEFGDELRWLDPPALPVGANLAFRSSAVADGPPFRVDLGRIGNVLLSSEETELVTRLRQRGHRLAYVPRAAILHRVPAQRATMTWLRKRAYWGGISFVRTNGGNHGASQPRLMRQVWHRVWQAAHTARAKGIGHEAQIDYAWRLGTVRQYVVEAARRQRRRALRSAPETP